MINQLIQYFLQVSSINFFVGQHCCQSFHKSCKKIFYQKINWGKCIAQFLKPIWKACCSPIFFVPEQQQVFTGFFSLVVLSSNALWAKVGKKCHIFYCIEILLNNIFKLALNTLCYISPNLFLDKIFSNHFYKKRTNRF